MLKYLQFLVSAVTIILVFNSCNNFCGKEESIYYFPPTGSDEWSVINPDDLGWSLEKLNQTIDFVKEQKSGALIILHEGRIVVEEYWMGWDKNFRGKIASINKSITSVLVGIAQAQGLLSINDNVVDYLGSGWSKADPSLESVITIRHLLTMTSGLDTYLTYRNDAGTEFYYNTIAFNKLWPIIEKASGESIDIFADKVLFKKIGMSKALKWYKGNNILPRDLARFGLLILNKGNWDSDEILTDSKYYEEMLSPSQSFLNCYGYLWWLNNMCNSNDDTYLINNAPKDLITALGAGDQKLYIVPSENLVIIRLGFDPGTPYWDDYSFNSKFWELMYEVIN